MSRLNKKRDLFRDDKGGTEFLETLILVTFLAVVAIVAVQTFSDRVTGPFGQGAPNESRPMQVGDL